MANQQIKMPTKGKQIKNYAKNKSWEAICRLKGGLNQKKVIKMFVLARVWINKWENWLFEIGCLSVLFQERGGRVKGFRNWDSLNSMWGRAKTQFVRKLPLLSLSVNSTPNWHITNKKWAKLLAALILATQNLLCFLNCL